MFAIILFGMTKLFPIYTIRPSGWQMMSLRVEQDLEKKFGKKVVDI